VAIRKKFTVTGLAGGLASLLGLSAPASAQQKMLVLLSAGDAESQAFMLVLAIQAKAQGGDVSMVLCSSAGDLALKSPPATATKIITPNGMSPRTLLEALVEKGGRVSVCAIYLPNRRLTVEALMPGVGAAKPQEVAAQMLDPTVKLVGQ